MLHRDFFKMLHLLYNIPLEKEVFYFDKKQENIKVNIKMHKNGKVKMS